MELLHYCYNIRYMDAKNETNESVEVVVLKSKIHTVTITSKGVRYKLFKVQFEPKGDIYVHFPYYKDSEGLVGEAFLKPNTTSIVLDPNCAKVTSHLVKYSHHSDGEAHFSQDGKIKTEIRKKSTPLNKLNGHLFTIMLQGIENFEETQSSKYDNGWSEEKSVINFDLEGMEFEALKFVAFWGSFENQTKGLNVPSGKDKIGPQIVYVDKAGIISAGFLIGPEFGNPFTDYILQLRVALIPKLSNQKETTLTFLGGFDTLEQVSDQSRNCSFLTFIYPHVIEKGKEGVVNFNSIDFIN